MDWVISSVWSSQVITALLLLLLYTSPAMVVSAVKNTTSYYLLLLLILMVFFCWFKQKLVRLVWCLLFEKWACNGIARYCCWSISSSCPSSSQQKISPNPQHFWLSSSFQKDQSSAEYSGKSFSFPTVVGNINVDDIKAKQT